MEGSHSGQVAGVTWTSVRTTLLRHSQAPPAPTQVLDSECMSRACSQSLLGVTSIDSIQLSSEPLSVWDNRNRSHPCPDKDTAVNSAFTVDFLEWYSGKDEARLWKCDFKTANRSFKKRKKENNLSGLVLTKHY